MPTKPHSEQSHDIIKIEDSPEPEPLQAIPIPSIEPAATNASSSTKVDPKDPEGFLRRCSGYNKKTKLRCSQVIGKNARHIQHNHPTYLPTCKAHQDQKTHAGWCQHRYPDGEKCGRLFRWTPNYFELCEEHAGSSDMPCHLLNLPLELRQQIFSYLLPKETIGSALVPSHRSADGTPLPPPYNNGWITSGLPQNGRRGGSDNSRSAHGGEDRLFPIPLLDLLLVNRQFAFEVKDKLFSTATFSIDIRRDGTFMCGRQVLEPRRADGSAHFNAGCSAEVGKRFINTFDFGSVKNYKVDILVENFETPTKDSWDEEVEIYDIRDYVGVTVSGILGLARSLCKLHVRVGVSNFRWSEDDLLMNTRSLLAPFERLRNVRQPKLCGVFDGYLEHNFLVSMTYPPIGATSATKSRAGLCSVLPLRNDTPLLSPGHAGFDAFKQEWEGLMKEKASSSVCKKTPIRAMFTKFKQFYTRLSAIVTEISYRPGRHAFLHRARVARENEDIEAFRGLRNELIQHWYIYLEMEEARKNTMNKELSAMLDVDVYPCHEAASPTASNSRRSSTSGSSSESPIVLDAEKMAAEGIPMQGNQMIGAQFQRAMLQQQAFLRERRKVCSTLLAHRANCTSASTTPSHPTPQLSTTRVCSSSLQPSIQNPSTASLSQYQLQLQLLESHCRCARDRQRCSQQESSSQVAQTVQATPAVQPQPATQAEIKDYQRHLSTLETHISNQRFASQQTTQSPTDGSASNDTPLPALSPATTITSLPESSSRKRSADDALGEPMPRNPISPKHEAVSVQLNGGPSSNPQSRQDVVQWLESNPWGPEDASQESSSELNEDVMTIIGNGTFSPVPPTAFSYHNDFEPGPATKRPRVASDFPIYRPAHHVHMDMAMEGGYDIKGKGKQRMEPSMVW